MIKRMAKSTLVSPLGSPLSWGNEAVTRRTMKVSGADNNARYRTLIMRWNSEFNYVDVIMNPKAIGQDLGRRYVSLDRQKKVVWASSVPCMQADLGILIKEPRREIRITFVNYHIS